jgi:hypothetical protein
MKRKRKPPAIGRASGLAGKDAANSPAKTPSPEVAERREDPAPVGPAPVPQKLDTISPVAKTSAPEAMPPIWQQGWAPDSGRAPWWSDAKKTLLTQFLALVLTPATVAVTVFITETYKAPSPRIEYMRVIPRPVHSAPSDKIADQIRNNPDLVLQFRRILYALTEGTTIQGSSDAWLDGQEWNPNLAPAYRRAATQVIEQLRVMKRHPPDKSAERLWAHFEPKEIDSMLLTLDGLMKELSSLDAKKAERNGGLEITLGVLNSGASDGTIFDEAALTCNGKTVTAFAENYVPVKAHGFEEVIFRTPRADGDDIISAYGRYTIGEEDQIKDITALVKSNKEIKIDVSITVSDKHATHKFTLNPD